VNDNSVQLETNCFRTFEGGYSEEILCPVSLLEPPYRSKMVLRGSQTSWEKDPFALLGTNFVFGVIPKTLVT
jgi:hypothetical protein